jgi:hypothetical protein
MYNPFAIEPLETRLELGFFSWLWKFVKKVLRAAGIPLGGNTYIVPGPGTVGIGIEYRW